MSHPPPGLGGGAARTGPPPGFGTSNASGMNPPNSAGGIGGGTRNNNGAASIVKAQLVMLLSSLNDETFEKVSKDVREQLASSNGPEIYHYYLSRIISNASTHIQGLSQHFQQYKEDLAAPPHNLPAHGPSAAAWRLLVSEAARAARDITLAPQFTLAVLSPMNSTSLPLPSLRLFGLPRQFLFSLAAFSLSATNIFPPSHPAHEQLEEILYQAYDATLTELHAAPGSRFWTYQLSPNHAPFSEDLSMQEARNLLLAMYPKPPSPQGASSRPPSPTNPLAPHPALLETFRRAGLVQGLCRKFQSPAVVLQTLSALSPGGPPRSPESIPLEHMLFEVGELTNDEQIVETIIQRWWRPWILESEDLALRNAEMTRTFHGLLEGLSMKRLLSINKVVEVLSSIPGIAWVDVMKSFDLPGLAQTPMTITLLIHMVLSTPQTPIPAVAGFLPASIDAPLWDNINSLLFMIKGVVDNAPDHFPIFTLREPSDPSVFARVVDPPSHTSELPEQAQSEADELQCAGIYNTMGFIIVIVAVFEMGEADESNQGLYEAVESASQLLDTGFQIAPELVILGLEKLNRTLPGRAHVAREALWKEYLIGNHEGKSTRLVFHQLWTSNPERFIDRLADFYAEDATRIERVVDIAQSLNFLGMLLNHPDMKLRLDVTAVCAEREQVDLENALTDGIDYNGEAFLQAIFDFVDDKIVDGFARRNRQPGDEDEDDNACHPPTPAVYSSFIRVLRNAKNLSPEDLVRFRNIRTDILILHPSLLNLNPGSKEEQGFSETKLSKDQAAQYEDYFKSMYDGDVLVDQQFEDLKRMHDSTDPADREFFAGCLHLLFDEFKWFDRYPPKQLAMTAVLFGTLIASGIIKDMPAFVASRYLVDACKTDISKPTYSFAAYALSVLRGSLIEFPGLCRSLKEIENLKLTHKDLVEAADNALKARAERDSQGGAKAAFPALRLPMLIEEGYDEFVEPDPKTKDAIMFIINQIAPSNYEQKSRDLLELFDDQYSRWFANYFIEVRVSLEQNRHELYMNIIDLLNSPVLERHILWETYRKTRDLINADATMSSSSQRASLKTIALWLGRITLARNKPIRMRELSVKDILIQGYDNKRLIVAIPFVCNVLASCKESVVFHLPNPWLSAMLGLLVEIYTFPEVRLNLKFEIEVLFTKLEVALNAVEPSTILRNRVAPSQPQGDAPDRLEQEYRRILAEMTSGAARMRTFGGDEAPSEVNEWFIARTEDLLTRLFDAMVFTPDFPFYQINSAKRAVHDATCLAIREMISPVVERSVTIAGISTRDLLAKDFSTEADSAKLRHAAQLMVKNLAGNLAMVTCKDPLRERMTSSIRTALIAAGFPESNMPDHIISGLVDDNLEVATAVLKSLTVDKASKDIDVNLAAHFASRREHHEVRPNQHFIDSASVAIALPPGSLPNILRMIPGGLLPQQLRVYEDFAEAVEQPRIYASNGHGGRSRETEHDRTGYQQELDSHTRRPSPRPRAVSVPEAVHGFQELAVGVDRIIASAPARSLSELPGDHPLRSYIINVIHLINQVAPADQPSAALAIAQKVVQLLYRSELNLGRETYVTMLQSLCELAAIVDKEVKDWLIHAEDARKLNVPVTIALIQVNMIAIQELDRRMSQMLSRNTLDRAEVEFVTELVREISTGESPMSSRNVFVHTLTSMLKLQENGMSDRGIDSLLSSLRRSKVPEAPRPVSRHTPLSDNGEPVVIDEKKQAQLKHFFLDWVRTYQTSSDIETAFRPYITYLHNEGILIGEDITTAFYKMAIHVAVDSFGQIGQEENASIGTDSLAKLMVLIVKNQYNNNRSTVPDLARSSYYFRKIITILSYCLIERHMEMGDQFDQRPWTRIFTSLLSELYQLGEQFSPLRRGCLRVLAKVLGTTQPVYAPRFAFGWMSIVSHRSFMPLLLFDDIEGSWSDYHKCLMWLLRFAEPFLKQGEMTHSSRSMYRGICRLFCVLMHDFPEFLDEYYHSFTTAIPPNCVQLRNIALSAFPVRDGPLPDPHRGLDHLLPEMQRYPIVRADYAEALEAGGIKAAIDQHVHTGMPGVDTIVAELRNRIAVKSLSADGPVITWNRTLLHAAVYYLGTSCIARIGEQTGIIEFNPKAAEVTILARLAHSLDGEGQYYLLSVVADQLRYPSAHTYFYISFMLYLFVSTSRTEQPNSIPDRIGRVLLERIIVQRPHPFGLLVCFVELMEDQQYGFWHQPFAQAPGELHDIFLRVQKNIVRARDDDMDRRAQKQLQAMNDAEDPEYRNSP